jgi:hypothetical protein
MYMLQRRAAERRLETTLWMLHGMYFAVPILKVFDNSAESRRSRRWHHRTPRYSRHGTLVEQAQPPTSLLAPRPLLSLHRIDSWIRLLYDE